MGTWIKQIGFKIPHQYIVLISLIYIAVLVSSCVNKGTTIVQSSNASLVFQDSLYFYHGQLYSGTIEELNTNEDLKSVKQILNGKEDGLQKGYHYNGQLSYEYNVEQGIRQGEYKEYFPSGDLQIFKVYNDEGRPVKTRIRDINGKVIANYVWKNNRYYGYLGSNNCISVINEHDNE